MVGAKDVKAGILLKQNPRAVQLYSALKTAASEVPDWPKTCIVPVLCTVGMQSSGKTTFVEALTRFRIGTTCSGTGTRCPVRYVLRDGEEYFSVGGKKLSNRQDIQAAVESHMAGLSDQPCELDRFSMDELKVEITSAGLPELDITDLPGLKTKGEGAEAIKTVVRSYVESESARPIVLVKATENVETQADVALLAEVGIEPGKRSAVFIVNYFNDQLYKFSRISELNEYCRGYVQYYHQVFFCMLVYSPEAKVKKDKLDFQGQCAYYTELPQKEKDAFDERVAACTKDEDLHVKHVTNNFGIAHAVHKMQSMIHEFINEQGRKYADRIAPLKEQYVGHIRGLETSLRQCNSDFIKEQREKFVEKFGQTVRCFQQCKSGLDLNLPPFDPMDSSQTFLDETKRVQELIGDNLLRKSRSATLPQYLLINEKLTADASLWRLCNVFDYVVRTQITIVPVKLNEACCISGYAPGDMPGAFDRLQVIKEVATRPLHEVASELPKMLNHVLAIYETSVEHALQLLKSHPGYTETLSKQVADAYKAKLKKLVDDSADDFKHVVFEMSSFMVADSKTRRSSPPRPELQTKEILRKLHEGISMTGWLKIVSKFTCCCCEEIQNFTLTADVAKEVAHAAFIASTAATYNADKVYEERLKEKKIEHEMSEVNHEAHTHCEQLKKELLLQLKNKISHTLFGKLKGPIVRDLRDDLAQQIRNVDAKQIDEDTKAKASKMRMELDEKQQHLAHIDGVLRSIDAMRDEAWSMVNGV
eukprot:TRINITY_DN95489_c0_g1_i1.p1 TRINITY_DN95489_c0_g1~~TRINITY_DN95489_c0_g1_i1.p1  ORF type:complete len:761 (+),score=179.54 TRINITY_DN95489_c0_g1_i1:50-2332(+)